MTHCDRINRALEFIEANLDNEIHLDSLAKESAFSKYHFHRIFRALIGDPPFKYIEKRRISKAAHDLLHSEKRIVDIAFDYGFNSHESFIRAFRKSFHQTPSHFRKTRPTVEFHAKCQLGALELMLKAGAVRLNPRIWHQPSFLLAGLAYSGRDSKAIYGLWEKFWQAASKAGKTVETAACKHAIIGLTQSVALEYAESNIRINAVCPGIVQTPGMERTFSRIPGFSPEEVKQWGLSQIPVKRFGSSDEVAQAVIWLCSDASSYLTGHSLVVDGGLHCK